MIPLDDIDESDYRLRKRVRSTKSMSPEEKAVRDALAAVQADTGVEKALELTKSASANSSFNQNQTPSAQNQSGSNQNQSGSSLSMSNPFSSEPIVKTVVYATPATPAPIPASTIIKTVTNPIKTATPDIVLFDDSAVPVEIMTDLIFENIGGQELINISRSDTINGQKIKYQPIKNISSINQEYNPNNILGLQKTSDKFFSGFAIKLENKVPNNTNSADNNPAYIDADGNLVVDSINLNNDEQIEIEIALSGTIYEAEI